MKMREVVLGIHDFAPPEGRITVELLDDRTGKVKFRERQDNAVQNWYVDYVRECLQMPPGSGGTVYPWNQSAYYPGPYDLNAAAFLDSTDRGQRALDGRQAIIPNMLALCSYSQLWLSDNSAAIAASDRWIPGTLIGGSEGRSETSYANLKVGAPVYSGSTVAHNSQSWRFEWGTTKANGTFRSVGFGCIQPDLRSSGNSNALVPWVGNGYTNQNNTTTPGDWPITLFASGSNNINQTDGVGGGYTFTRSSTQYFLKGSGTGSMTVYTTALIMPTASYTVTNANLGTPNSSYQTICHQGSSLWVHHGTNAWRQYAPPVTSTTPTLTNSGTFTGFTDTGILGSATDGTNIYILGQTKVFVWDPATQTVTSSWTHGVTAISGVTSSTQADIAYDPITGWLCISHQDSIGISLGTTAWTNLAHGKNTFFTTAGVQKSIFYSPGQSTSAAGSVASSGLIHEFLANGHPIGECKASSSASFQYMHLWMPNMRSAVVLGADVTKTSSNSLRVTYDLTFS